MIAIDTNLLVYAHRSDSHFHELASLALGEVVNATAPWALPWPCVHEFIAVVTHPRIYKQPTPLAQAFEAIHALTSRSNTQVLAESAGYLQRLEQLALSARLTGAMIHDARIAALCLHHGVRVLLSADRDFSRFPALIVRNPLRVA